MRAEVGGLNHQKSERVQEGKDGYLENRREMRQNVIYSGNQI